MAVANLSVKRGFDGLTAGAVAASSDVPSSALLDGSTRLYRLDAEGELAGLQVEAFVLEEALSQPWRLDLSVLHERADLDLDAMLGRQATLITVLADGSEHRRTAAPAWSRKPRPKTATAASPATV